MNDSPKGNSIKKPVKRRLVTRITLLFLLGFLAAPSIVQPESKEHDLTHCLPEEVHTLFERTCFSCHRPDKEALGWAESSFLFSWWYKMQRKDAQAAFDFSVFQNASRQAKAKAARSVADMVEQGSMPPWSHRVLHWGAFLSECERRAIHFWAIQQGAYGEVSSSGH